MIIECDRNLVCTEGFIENYGFPEPLTLSAECEYNIQVAKGYKIFLTIQNLSLSCQDVISKSGQFYVAFQTKVFFISLV